MGTSSAHMGVTQKTGWLTRRGVRGNTWERRFFVLDAEKLRYFQSPSDDEPDGTILLDGTTLALASENAGSELEMMQWVRATRREPTVALVDFEMLSKLGESKLGKLVLVKQKPKGRLFAMKILNKSAILGPMETAAQHMQAERRMLQKIRHPYVVGLRHAFQTREKLYMVMDYIPGGDLYYHLRQHGSFCQPLVRIWAAQLVLALGYLHKLGISYCDLRPENLLVDCEGNVHLTDFGLSRVQSSDQLRAGSPAYYAAPELLHEQNLGRVRSMSGLLPENQVLDWWSLGVLCYELLVGGPPFHSSEPQQLQQQITAAPIVLPALVTGTTGSFVLALLHRDRSRRLGAKGGAAEVMQHPFFAEGILVGDSDEAVALSHKAAIDWDVLLHKDVSTGFTVQNPIGLGRRTRDADASPVSDVRGRVQGSIIVPLSLADLRPVTAKMALEAAASRFSGTSVSIPTTPSALSQGSRNSLGRKAISERLTT